MRQKHLDRSRAHGEIHPPGSHGATYEQDGYHFDHDGKLVESLLTEQQREALTRPEPKAKPAGPVLTPKQIELLRQAGTLTSEQEKAFAESQKPNKPPKPGSSGDGDGDSDSKKSGEPGDDDLNLELWLKGEIEYDFRDVQNAVKARFQKWCTRKDDLVQFLVDPKAKGGAEVVAASEVCPALKKFLGED